MVNDADTVAAATLEAWSQCDPPELTEPLEAHPRWSGVLKVAAAFMAVACGAAATAVLLWPTRHPTSSAPPPAPETATAAPAPPFVAPTVAAEQQNPDARFVNIYKIRGYKGDDYQTLIRNARQVCSDQFVNITKAQSARSFFDAQRGRNDTTEAGARSFVDTAIGVYCPQFADRP